jgi:hypothetical protein
MSPEQAEGKETDERSDVFSFGLVMYEMLTGRRAFDGETKTAVLAAILRDQPAPIQQFQPMTPRSLDRVVRKCLEKKPTARWHSAHDLKQTLELIDLDAPASGSASALSAASVSGASGVQAAGQRASRRRIWTAIAAAGVALLAAGAWEWWRANRFTDLPVIRQDVDLGSDIALPGPTLFVTNVVISPEGTRIAYVARPASGGAPRLYTRRLDQPMAVELPGTENARGPFFSPDLHWLGFISTSARKLYKISVDGGATVPLMDLKGTPGGASWSGNTIVVAQGGSPLVRIADNGGGQPTPLGPFAPGEIIQVSPQILPGNKTVLFAGNTGNEGGPPDPDRGSVEAISLKDGHRKNILKGGAFPRYVASHGGWGHILYTFRGALYAVPFDPDKLEVLGAAVPVLNDIMGGLNVAGKFDVSGNGTLVYQKGTGVSDGLSTIQWIDSNGKTEPLLAKPGIYSSPRLSPDGKRLVLSVRDGQNQDIEVYEWQTGRTTSLTFGRAQFEYPVWTPDGQFVAFLSTNGSTYSARADGSGQPQQIMAGTAVERRYPWSFTPDGKRLAYFQPVTGRYQLWTIPVEEQEGALRAGTSEPFLKSEANDLMPQFSPDGKWIAYQSNLSEGAQIYVRPASGKPGQWVVSAGTATWPVWSRSGHDLFYADSAENQIMSVSYTASGDTFVAEKPRVWLAKLDGLENWDVSPDGKRIVAAVPVRSAAPAPAPQNVHEVVFLENFFDELRRRAPAK